MKRFNYKAKDKEGRSVVGEVEASDVKVAVKLIREKGLFVISIKPADIGIFAFIKNMRTQVKSSDVTTFTRQFSTMVNAGLPIAQALSILRTQSKPSLQPVVRQILGNVESGQSLSNSLAQLPEVFPTSYIALVKSGETGGVLDKVLARLADNMEKQEEFNGKVKTALIYPSIIVTGMIIVAFVMMIFVIPKLTTLYSEFDAELPLPTRILITISSTAVKIWPVTLGLIALGIWGFISYRKTKGGRRKIDELIFKIPITGELQRQVILTELTRTLSLMVGSGVSILEGLAISSEVVTNTVVSDALKDAAKQIEKGFPVAYSFAKHPEAFPYLLSQMVAVGEETGKMQEVLDKVSRVFEVESDQKVKALTASVEPIVMIILGLGVGFLVIAIILPIYNLTSQF